MQLELVGLENMEERSTTVKYPQFLGCGGTELAVVHATRYI